MRCVCGGTHHDREREEPARCYCWEKVIVGSRRSKKQQGGQKKHVNEGAGILRCISLLVQHNLYVVTLAMQHVVGKIR